MDNPSNYLRLNHQTKNTTAPNLKAPPHLAKVERRKPAPGRRVDIRNAPTNCWGERRGGPRGAPEEVPPPPGRCVAPRGAGGDPGQRHRNETPRIRMRMMRRPKPLTRMRDRVKRASHAGKGVGRRCAGLPAKPPRRPTRRIPPRNRRRTTAARPQNREDYPALRPEYKYLVMMKLSFIYRLLFAV